MQKFWILVFLLFAIVSCDRFGGGEETPVVEEIETTPTLTGETTSTDHSDGNSTTSTATDGSRSSTGETTTNNAGTPTPDTPYLIAVQDMNVRRGPGRQYEQIGGLYIGESATIIGRAPNALWWQIECPPVSRGNVCWVSGGSQYTEDFNTDDVPLVDVPPTPVSSPTP